MSARGAAGRVQPRTDAAGSAAEGHAGNSNAGKRQNTQDEQEFLPSLRAVCPPGTTIPPADPETSVKGPQKYCQPAKTPKTRKPLLTCQSRHGRGTGNQLCFLMKVSKVFGPRQECICNLKNHKNTESTHKNRITAKQQPHML